MGRIPKMIQRGCTHLSLHFNYYSMTESYFVLPLTEKSHTAQTGEWVLILGLKIHSFVLLLAAMGSSVSWQQVWAFSLGSALAVLPRKEDRAGLCRFLGLVWWAKSCCEDCEHPSVAIAFNEAVKEWGKLCQIFLFLHSTGRAWRKGQFAHC